jgi:peptidoglycan/LPS O-acetylase OafA/YrhL
MQISPRALTLLLLVAGCLLVSDVLPAFQKLWFVDESGKIDTSYWLDALLIVLLFRKWRPARTLLLLITGVHTTLFIAILGYSLSHGGHLLGYCLVLPLLLLAMGILAYSTALKQFLSNKFTASVGGFSS